MREQLRVSRKMMARAIHPVLTDRCGDEGVNLATHRHLSPCNNVIIRGARAFHRWMSRTNRARWQLRRRKYAEATARTKHRLTRMPLARDRNVYKVRGSGAHRGQIA